MISEIFLEKWRKNAKWKTLEQVEQDLIISRALVDLYNDQHIKDALVFRGGSALNKLFINPSARFSDDIDFVQKRVEPISKTVNAIRETLRPWLGDPEWKITHQGAKLLYKYEDIGKKTRTLKVEIDTTENFQFLPLQNKDVSVNSEWFHGSASIVTYEIEELMSTKLRALYQRRKGRDLFDLWYVTKQGLIDVDKMIHIFGHYCSKDGIKISGRGFANNLLLKKEHPDFRIDMHALLSDGIGWDFEEAYQYVMDNIINRLLHL